jgi:ribosomal-protein-serine acetyltransferase
MHAPEEIDAGPVVLRRWREDQAAALATAVTESLPELRAFLPWAIGDYDTESVSEFLRECVRHWEEGTGVTYAMRTHAWGSSSHRGW